MWSKEKLLTTGFLIENSSLVQKFLNKYQIELEEIYFLKSFKYEDIKKEIKENHLTQIIFWIALSL